MERNSSLARDLQNQGEGGSSDELIGGYDLSFVDDVDDDLKCIVCLEVMKDPYQIVPCGHTFCWTCLDQLIRYATNVEKKAPKCPLDREEISLKQMFPHSNCKRKIMCLEILCKNSAIGCEWHSSLSELEDHIAKTCLYVESSCSFEGCKSLFLKRQKEDHEANCRWRIVKCDFCSDDFRAFELKEHINTLCPSKTVPCPNNGCQKVIQRRMVQHHIDEECLLTPKSCPVEFLGCQEKGTRSSVNKHIVKNAYNHIELLCSELKSMNLRMESKNKEFAALQEKVKEQEVRLNPTRRYGQTKDKDIFEKELLFIWPIQVPAEDQYDGFDAISPTYSTGPHGYFFHFNLKLVKWDAMMTEISPSFQLLPGPYDSLLPWPFRCKFLLYVIKGSSRQRTLLAKYDGKDDPEKRACFQKPPEDGNPWYSMPECSWFNIKMFLSNNIFSMIVAIESYSAAER